MSRTTLDNPKEARFSSKKPRKVKTSPSETIPPAGRLPVSDVVWAKSNIPPVQVAPAPPARSSPSLAPSRRSPSLAPPAQGHPAAPVWAKAPPVPVQGRPPPVITARMWWQEVGNAKNVDLLRESGFEDFGRGLVGLR